MPTLDDTPESLAKRLAQRGVRRGGLSPPPRQGWTRSALASQVSELSGGRAAASLTLAGALILDAQRQGELAAWVTTRASCFYPPDLAARGIDLEALVVVRVPRRKQVAAAAARLAQSGAFGLLILDLGRTVRLPQADQARLAGCASRDGTAVLCLTRKNDQDPSLGALVALRAASALGRDDAGRLRVTLRVLKDKRRGPGWEYSEVVEGVEGLT